MPRFKLTIENITCQSITDSLLEGNEDDLYLRIWHKRYSSVLILKEIPLGKFIPGSSDSFSKPVVDDHYDEIESLGFDIFDSDIFTPDDLLGGFILGSDNRIRMGMYTTAEEDNALSTTLTLNGNGGQYLVSISYEVFLC